MKHLALFSLLSLVAAASVLAATQQFRDVQITQDGALASVTLVFVNTRSDGSASWGWKSMQLLKIGGQWKSVSEFFTSHPLDKKLKARAGPLV